MSLTNAQSYARRARDAGDSREAGDNAYRAIEELVKEIKRLEVRVAKLEAKRR